MNYYIQGSPARAEEIKAAFKKLCYDTGNLEFTSSLLYYTIEGKVELMCPKSLQNIIKTHPDYKELELPVEPKFKVGDWIACDADSFTLSIKSVRDENYYFHQGASLPIKDIDEHYHLWTLADAKDGDVLVNQNGEMPFVFKSRKDNHIYCYCAYTNHKDIFFEKFLDDGKELHWINLLHEQVQPANKEQRDLLFAKMLEAGYTWDEKKKELRKIQPHYDIANFKPFDKVLVRDEDTDMWTASLYSNYDNFTKRHFVAIDSCYSQCIPFNEETKHLLGTNDMCDEQYINW